MNFVDATGTQVQKLRMTDGSKLFDSRIVKVLCSLVILCIVHPFPACSQGNFPGAPDFNSVGNQTEMPIPGAGHDYQSLLGETVNFGTGSVSFKISFPVPKSRGITMPYNWTYNSASANPLNMVDGSQPTWDAYWIQNGITTDGWNTMDGIPWASVSVWSYKPPDNGVQTFASCNVQSGMTFTGMDGVMHNLNVSAQATSASGSGITQICGTQPYVPPNGDGQVLAVPDPNTAATYLAGTAPQSGSFMVGDKNGTLYFIHGGVVPQNGSATLDVSAEDRNGNLISSSAAVNTTQTISFPVGSTTQTFQMPKTITIGNLTYTAAWSTINVNYTIQQKNMIGSGSAVLCNSVPTSVSGTRVVLSSLTLPNNKAYNFHYDPTYGTLSEIDYPDGGWVKYTWGLTSGENEYADFAGSEQSSCSQSGCTYAPVSYGCAAEYQTPILQSRTVSFDGSSTAQTQSLSYTTSWDAPDSSGNINGWNQKQTTVTTTDGKTGLSAKTVYSFTPYTVPVQPMASGAAGAAMPQESEIDYYDWGKSTPVKIVTKTWQDQFDLASETTKIVASNEIAGTVYTYGEITGGTVSASQYLQYLLERDDYDYGTIGISSRQPTKKTIYTYHCCETFPTSFDSLYTVPPSETVPSTGQPGVAQVPLTVPPLLVSAMEESGAGTVLAVMNYSYDTTAPVSVSAINHDSSFGVNMSPQGRGQLTSITRCSSPASGCNVGPTVTYTYDITGQPYSVKDARGNTSTFSFVDNPTQSGGNTNAYLTSVTNPLNQTRTFTYNYVTGYMTSATDWNNSNATQYQYNDPLDRLSEVDLPDNGKSTISYDDSGNSSTTRKLISGTLSGSSCSGTCETTESVRDGMFHTIHSYVLSDPDGQDNVDTTYDGEGRVLTVTNAYRGTSAPTGNTITNSYDALGRKIQVQEQDGRVQQWCYDGVSSTLPGGSGVSYCSSAQLYTSPSSTWAAGPPGTWVDSTDENGNHWERGSNYFGDLLDVMEPNGSSTVPSMETDYSYDLLNNLLSVGQKGKSGETARTRTFVYDGLSRLHTSSNPETGTITYGYDLNNNLTSKTDLRNITVQYTYDALNRLLAKTYSDGTLASCFQYDTVSKGYLTAEWTQAGSSCPASASAAGYQSLRQIGAYDVMGRVTSEQQCVLGFCTSAIPPPAPAANCQSLSTANGLAYCYDLAGNPTAYGNGLTSVAFPQQYMLFSQGFDSVSRLSSVTNGTWSGSTFPSNLFTSDPSYGYTPYNALQSWISGNGNLSVSKSYDGRMRVTGETAIQQ